MIKWLKRNEHIYLSCVWENLIADGNRTHQDHQDSALLSRILIDETVWRAITSFSPSHPPFMDVDFLPLTVIMFSTMLLMFCQRRWSEMTFTLVLKLLYYLCLQWHLRVILLKCPTTPLWSVLSAHSNANTSDTNTAQTERKKKCLSCKRADMKWHNTFTMFSESRCHWDVLWV